MKKAIMLIVAMVFCVAGHAGTVFIMGNEEGTGINFTDASCDGDAGNIVYTRAKGGRVSHGCYKLIDDGLMVRWSDGQVYFYPLEDMAITDYGRSKYQGGEDL